MQNRLSSLVFVGALLVFALVAIVYQQTDGFAPSDNVTNLDLVASTDATVRQTAPGVSNDITEGFLPGYLWIDQTGGAVYIAEDTTAGAAVWTDITAGGSTFNIEEDDVLVAANVNVIDLLSVLDASESPPGEVNISIDYLEDPIDLSTGEVTGTLDLSDHVNLSAGTGATLTGDSLSVDLGTAIDTSEITDGTILEADLAAVDTPIDEECLTYEATVGDYEWQACGSGGGGTHPVDLTSDVTGTLPVGNGGTGQTAATADGFLVGNGSAFVVRVATDCDAAGSAVTYDTTTDALGCATGYLTTVDLTSDVTGTLPVGNGGTGQTAATADALMVANGSAYVARVVPDCDATGSWLRFDQTTDAWSCSGLTAGTNITLTGDTLNVDDAFILNTGDTGTGAYDFGGATDFEIPNGATETPNAAGEIAVDTTDDQLKYFGAAERAVTYLEPLTFILEDPADADEILGPEAFYDYTILNITCLVDRGDTAESVVIQLLETDSTADNGVGVDGATTITCDNDGADDDGSLSNPTIDTGDSLLLDIGTVTGTVSWVRVTVNRTATAT